MKNFKIKSYKEKYIDCTITYFPRFSESEKTELQKLKAQMDESYPHEDGSKWSDETMEVRVEYDEGKCVGLIPTDDMVYILDKPYCFELKEK